MYAISARKKRLTAPNLCISNRKTKIDRKHFILVQYKPHFKSQSKTGAQHVHKSLLMNRKKLKGSGVIVADDLCQEMIKVYNRVRNDPRVKDAWTWFGKIFVLWTESGRWYRCGTYSE